MPTTLMTTQTTAWPTQWTCEGTHTHTLLCVRSVCDGLCVCVWHTPSPVSVVTTSVCDTSRPLCHDMLQPAGWWLERWCFLSVLPSHSHTRTQLHSMLVPATADWLAVVIIQTHIYALARITTAAELSSSSSRQCAAVEDVCLLQFVWSGRI